MLETAHEEKRKLALYPFSLIALGVWIVHIIATIIILDMAAAAAPRSVHQPWEFSVLPGLMLTLFAQAHATITAMHLARIGVSALQSTSTSPRSWAELFWLADRSWQGPVGIITTGLAMRKMKVQISHMFVMFALTCMVALVTPVILSRAYPVGVVIVSQKASITPSTISSYGLESVDISTLTGIGSGSWATGLSVLDLYNTSTYVPQGQPQSNASDIFFAGDLQGANATLPGLRLQGACQPYTSDPAMSVKENNTSLSTFCTDSLSSIGDHHYNLPFLECSTLSVSYGYCTDAPFFDNNTHKTVSKSNAYIFFNTTNVTDSAEGMVKCQSKLSLGTAFLSGSQGTYHSFQESPIYNESLAFAGDILLYPLNSVLDVLVNGAIPFGSLSTTALQPISELQFAAALLELQCTTVRQLGYKTFIDPNSPWDFNYTQPTLDDLANNIWLGVTHMTAVTGLLSWTSDTVYSANVYQTTSGRTRSPNFVGGAIVLVSMWLAALVYATARSYRTTFSDSLNSYEAGRLLTHEVDLVEGHLHGQLSDNTRLSAPFVWSKELRKPISPGL